MKKAMVGNENPYAPPGTVDDRVRSTGRSFEVGRDEINTIFVEASPWTGIKTYSTNAAGKSTPVLRGPCRFEVGERERHQVEIQFDRTASINALVDGELVERNLSPLMRAASWAMLAIAALLAILIYVVVSRVMGFIFNT